MTMIFNFFLIVFAFTLTFVCPFLSSSLPKAFAQNNKDEIIASVGARKISLGEFNRKFEEVRNQTVNPPTKTQFLEDLVRLEVGLQEAEKKGLGKDPLVQERMRQELYKALLEKELGEKIQKTQISNKELEDYYKKNPDIRSSHILIQMKIGASAEQKVEAKKRAQEIYDEVKKSKRPFEDLVKLYSDDSFSKENGGDVGWQNRITIAPNFYETLLKLKLGDIYGLIETQYGYHIVKVTGRRSFEKADKKTLRMAVFDEKRKQTFNDYFEKLKKTYKIQTNVNLIE